MALCIINVLLSGVEFFLNNQQILTDGSGLANVTDIGTKDDDALIQSELTSNLTVHGHWYLKPGSDRRYTNTPEENKILSNDPRGWTTNGHTDPDGHEVVRLMRVSPTAVEGRFTCHIRGDMDTPRALGIFYPSGLYCHNKSAY